MGIMVEGVDGWYPTSLNKKFAVMGSEKVILAPP
jgi:hypothetical protein